MTTTTPKKNKKEVSSVEVVVNNPNPDLVIEKMAQLMPFIVSRIAEREFAKKL
jgi:hypothetical protein